MNSIKRNGHSFEISNPDKLIFPGSDIRKQDLLDFYGKIADYILPMLKDRPLVMHRFPDGIHGTDFYQKSVPDYFPDWIDTVDVTLRTGSKQTLVVCSNEATLLYLVNQAMITPHSWLSRTEGCKKPDRLIFDLDPSDEDFEKVRTAALDLKTVLDAMDMKSFVMTSGSRGLHVHIPLDGNSGFDECRAFAKSVAEQLVSRKPEKYTIQQRIEKRKGRLFLDYLRNAYGQTAVAPYALRALPGAPVATVLDWDELNKGELNAQSYHFRNIFKRLSHKQNPWREWDNYSYNPTSAQLIDP